MSPQEVVDKPYLEGIPLFRQLISHQTHIMFHNFGGKQNKNRYPSL